MRNGRIGGKLFSLFPNAGFLEVVEKVVEEKTHDFSLAREIFRFDLIASDAIERGLVSAGSFDAWLYCLESAETFEASLAMFVVRGIKPR